MITTELLFKLIEGNGSYLLSIKENPLTPYPFIKFPLVIGQLPIDKRRMNTVGELLPFKGGPPTFVKDVPWLNGP